ncbi:MAG: hypothetical protein WCL26_06810, partial [Actinomycetes bacterium]
MSTKTSFKRIAAVAAVALTLGGFSAVSANATVSVTSYATDYASTSVALGQDAVLVLHQDFLASAVNDTQTLTVAVTGNVYGTTPNTTWPTVFKGSDTATVSTGTDAEKARGYAAGAVYGGFPAADITAGSTNVNNNQVVTNSPSTVITVKNSAVAAARVRGFERIEWKPTAAGTYSLKITSDSPGDSLWSYTWTFTVGSSSLAVATVATTLAGQTPSATFSKAVNGYNYCGTPSICATLATYDRAYDVATIHSATDEAVYYSKNLALNGSSIAAAAILGDVNSTASTGNTYDAMNGAYVFASITGPGWLNLSDNPVGSTVAAGRSVYTKLGTTSNRYKLVVGSDGTAGVATITISAANSLTATPVVIATKTVTFYDTPAKASLTRLAYSINGDAGASATSAFTLTITDAAGNKVPYVQAANLGYFAKAASDNSTILPASTTLTSATVSLAPKGALYGTANITVTVSNDAAGAAGTATGLDAAGFKTNTFATSASAITVAKNQVAKLTITSDASSYSPGQAGVITFSALDVNNLPVPDALVPTVSTLSTVATSGSITTGFSQITSIGGFGYQCPTYVAGTSLVDCGAGISTVNFYAPIAEGNFTVNFTLGSGFSTALAATVASLTANVGASAATSAAQAAQDAANEATDAANAATDAANNAMD